MPPAPVYRDPCNGQFPHAQRLGCCPIEISLNNRVPGAGGVRPATVATPLPTGMAGAVTTQDLAYLNTVDHSPDNAFDLAGSNPTDLLAAAQSGVVDAGTIMGELARRIPGAADADARGVLTSSITALKALIDAGVIQKSRAESNGNYLRMWALSVKKVKHIDGPLTVLEPDDKLEASLSLGGEAGTTTNRSKILLPRLGSELLFMMAVYQWTVLCHMYGVMPTDISSHFIFEVVYLLIVKHKFSFWTAQEYLIECLDLLDKKVCTVATVFSHDRGVMLQNADRLGGAFAQHFARKNKGAPLVGPGSGSQVPWNGLCQPCDSSANPCQSFNRNKAHDRPEHLNADGTCKFRHVCNRWVTDKGPSGKCLSTGHGWYNCSNPNKTTDGKPHQG